MRQNELHTILVYFPFTHAGWPGPACRIAQTWCIKPRMSNLRPLSSARILSRRYKTLCVEARVRIVELLKAGPLCVGALAKELSMTPAGVSQHLRILREAGLVIPEKSGYFVHYRLDTQTLHGWGESSALFFADGP
jgi:DNA-binding transcriptional ArsR family regulator